MRDKAHANKHEVVCHHIPTATFQQLVAEVLPGLQAALGSFLSSLILIYLVSLLSHGFHVPYKSVLPLDPSSIRKPQIQQSLYPSHPTGSASLYTVNHMRSKRSLCRLPLRFIVSSPNGSASQLFIQFLKQVCIRVCVRTGC